MTFAFTPERRARVAALISGRGSNMLALLDAAAAPDYPAKIVLALSDHAAAPGLAAAAARGVRVGCAAGASRAEREAALDAQLRAAEIDLIAMAGFMRVLSASFVEAWRDRILNIHPSLLPSFRGLDTHARALAAGVRLHGATVHLARAALDDGPILAQAALSVDAADTADGLAARVLALEHAIYAPALGAYAAGALRLEDGRIVGATADPAAALVAGVTPRVPHLASR